MLNVYRFGPTIYNIGFKSRCNLDSLESPLLARELAYSPSVDGAKAPGVGTEWFGAAVIEGLCQHVDSLLRDIAVCLFMCWWKIYEFDQCDSSLSKKHLRLLVRGQLMHIRYTHTMLHFIASAA